MAPTKNKVKKHSQPQDNSPFYRIRKYLSKDNLYKYLSDPHNLLPTCILLLLFEIVLNVFIIETVKYTEIDWIAYMQEVEGFLNGTWDYKELKGDTGPLVYPAGFVYIYSALYYITSQGKNIYLAQYIFLGLYLMQTLLYYRILLKTAKVPPYALIIATLTSYRIHSIFVLRLFNDPIAVLLFYVSLNLFISDYWILGSILYSLAVSVKMNILLYAPCLLIAYLTNLTIFETVINLTTCALVQLVLGLPFLYINPWTYIRGSFDIGRIFEHRWTVNYRFLSKEVFESRYLHFSLLALHLLLLLIFSPIFTRYLKSYAKLNIVTAEIKKQMQAERLRREEEMKKEEEKMTKKQKAFLEAFEKQLSDSGLKKMESSRGPYDDNNKKLEDRMSKVAQLFVLPFFVANLIGIACARSLHYQFYSWYFHSLLYLVYSTRYQKPILFLILAVIEYCWNVYPSTNTSSVLLHCCHVVLLFGVYRNMKQ